MKESRKRQRKSSRNTGQEVRRSIHSRRKRPKLSAQQSKEKKVTLHRSHKKEKLLRMLDQLAWLLQKDSKSCTALVLFRQKLFIADNTIHENTKTKIPKIWHIINYFSLITDTDIDYESEEFSNKRVDIFKFIFDRKFSGEEAGYFTRIKECQGSIRDKLIPILTQIFSSKKQSQLLEQLIANTAYRLANKTAHHSRSRVACAFQIGIDIIRRLKRVERILRDENEEIVPLKVALNKNTNREKEKGKQKETDYDTSSNQMIIEYSDSEDISLSIYKWIHKMDTSGCAILATHLQAVHAEAVIIDFLLASNVLSIDEVIEDYLLIGISKACCLHCWDLINFTNQTLREKSLTQADDYLRVTGAHSIEFDKWNETKPRFLLFEETTQTIANENPGKEYIIEEIHYIERNKVLGRAIKECFDTKHQEFNIIFYQSHQYHIAARNKAAAFLRSERYSKTLVLYQNKGKWYYAGRDYISGKVKHILLPEQYFKKSKRITEKMNKYIIKNAKLKLSYIQPEQQKGYTSHDSASTSPSNMSSDDEHEHLTRPPQLAQIKSSYTGLLDLLRRYNGAVDEEVKELQDQLHKTFKTLQQTQTLKTDIRPELFFSSTGTGPKSSSSSASSDVPTPRPTGPLS